jgi:hypothetical protein
MCLDKMTRLGDSGVIGGDAAASSPRFPPARPTKYIILDSISTLSVATRTETTGRDKDEKDEKADGNSCAVAARLLLLSADEVRGGVTLESVVITVLLVDDIAMLRAFFFF